MKTIETKPGVALGFWSPGNDKLLTTKDSNVICIKGDTTEVVKVIGKLSEITEEQAKELVEQVEDYGGYPLYKQYSRYLNLDDFDHAKSSLISAADSLGIEEKDFENYLVIKL